VLERRPRAQGASVRNFGMLWPVGQPAGPRYRLARRSLEVWREVLSAAGLWHEQCGSLHLAYHDDEAQVLREFVAAEGEGRGCELLDARQVAALCPAVRQEGLLAALWSAAETCVDPREVIAGLPGWLARAHGVEFVFGCRVLGYERPVVRTAQGDRQAGHLLVCTGDDFEGLYPALFAASGLVRCKLQMMRSPPLPGRRLGPMLAAGLTLRHYAAFAACPSLPALVRRLDAELPEYGRFGIHVMAAQNGRGELVLGDSHEYGDAVGPFDKPSIDDLILRYLARFLDVPGLTVAERWHGTYARHPSEPYFLARPAEGVTVLTGLGGAGMTLSFGVAEQVVGAGTEAIS
jgi:FAD dependent oxidoreductase TIGR03364